MNSTAKITVLILLALVLSALGGAFYIVSETKQVVITMFGNPIGDPVTTPGLHVKFPFIHKANYFDKIFLEWDGDPNQVPTRDKRFIYIDTYARWRISDPLKYAERLFEETKAQSRLDAILDGETRNVVARFDLIEVVRSSNREFAISDETTEMDNTDIEKITSGRSELAQLVLKEANIRSRELGIEILDFRFKRINYVEEVRKEVYARMISERNRIAEQFRSEGAGESARINGQKDRELKQITSAAYRDAQVIKGKADAEAADIFAEAYNSDPEFYRFLKSMEILEASFDKETVLLLSTDGDLLRFLNQAK